MKKIISEVVEELQPVLKAFNLRANRIKELRKARRINNEISEKVHELLVSCKIF